MQNLPNKDFEFVDLLINLLYKLPPPRNKLLNKSDGFDYCYWVYCKFRTEI